MHAHQPLLTCSPVRQLGGASTGRSDAARLRRQQANLYVRNLGEMASEHLRALFQVHSWVSLNLGFAPATSADWLFVEW